jgi:hypothetical protein
VGVLAHYLERAGVATTQISLIRLHTEKIRPPRALWVPFQLGRPLGDPEDPAFQTRVLRSALALLERTDGPVLEIFPDDAPSSAATAADAWVCPIGLPAGAHDPDPEAALLDEIAAIQPWYELARERHGRTTVGASGMDIAEVAIRLNGLLDPQGAGSFEEAGESRKQLHHLVGDLRAYYTEAATAQPGRTGLTPSSREIENWFWEETEAAQMLLRLRDRLSDSADPELAFFGRLLTVPFSHQHLAPAGS